MIKHVICCAAAAAVLVASGAQAQDICQLPGAPPDQSARPTRPNKPVAPSCVNVETQVANCRPKVLAAYNASIDEYNAKLMKFNQDAHIYVNALNGWQQAVENYATCEIELLNRGQ